VSETPWSHLVTEERIADLHAASLVRHGGRRGAPKPGCVDGSLGAAWSAEQYTIDEDGVAGGLVFAGNLMFYLARNHCFVDGNKRAAWLAATEILLKHDLTIDAPEDEVFAFMEAVADGAVERAERVIEWIAARLASAAV
jgi:death on curing protein